MRSHQRLARQLVERAREPLGQPAAVDEDQRRAMRANQLEQLRMDGRPDRRPRVADRRRPARDLVRGGQLGHVLDRHLDAERERLLLSGVDDGHRAVADRAAVDGELVVDFSLARGDARARVGAPATLDRVALARFDAARETVRPRRAAAGWLTGRYAAAVCAQSAVEPLERQHRGARRVWSGRARESRR